MKDRMTPIAVVVLLLLCAAYAGSYVSLVGAGPHFEFDDEGKAVPVASYRRGGRGAEMFYWPISQIDRQVRRSTWRKLEAEELMDFTY